MNSSTIYLHFSRGDCRRNQSADHREQLRIGSASGLCANVAGIIVWVWFGILVKLLVQVHRCISVFLPLPLRLTLSSPLFRTKSTRRSTWSWRSSPDNDSSDNEPRQWRSCSEIRTKCRVNILFVSYCEWGGGLLVILYTGFLRLMLSSLFVLL